MKKFSFLFLLTVLVASAWWFGQAGNPPVPANSTALAKEKIVGVVKGAQSDRVPPESNLIDPPKEAGKGVVLSGLVRDEGSGVAGVVYQIQRISDGAVYNDGSWQLNVGTVQEAVLNDTKDHFSFSIPASLAKGQEYVIRTQAMDKAGNAQTKWSEHTVTGQDAGDSFKAI